MASSFRTSELPAASVTVMDATFHTPGSLDGGKVTWREPVTCFAGEKTAEPFCLKFPDGLTNTTSANLTPDELSVAVSSTVTVTGPWVVSIESGVTLKAVRFGGTVSGVELTCSERDSSLAASSASRTRVLPAASTKKTLLNFQWPGSLNAGKFTFTEFFISVAGGNTAEPLCFVPPDGLANTTSIDFTPERSSVAVKSTFTFAVP